MPPSSREYRFGEFRILPDAAQLLRGEEHVPLTPKAIRLLIALVERHDHTVGKQELLDLVWAGVTVEDGNLAYTVNQIRRVLGKDSILTVSKLGYRFALPLDNSPSPPHRSASRSSSGTNLPTRARKLIGRDADIERLDALLAEHPLVTVVGPPGVGKTSLCKAAAQRALGRMTDGIWFFDVPNGAEIGELAGAVASFLGAKVRAGANPAYEIATAIGQGRMMLVFDGCETSLPAVAQLVAVLAEACPNLSVLATSRRPLRVAAERVMRLRALATAGSPETVAEALNIPAVALLLDRAAAVNAEFRISDTDALRAAVLCRTLDGLPLALEMVGARAPTLGLGVLHDRLAEIFLRSDGTLRSAFDLSWSLLSEDRRKVLSALSIFAASFDYDAADACARDGLGTGIFVDCLAELIDESLLVVEGEEIHRYRLLDTVRAYVRERMEGAELARLQAVAAGYFAARMTEADEQWNLQPEATWLAQHAQVVDDLRCALKWAFSADGDRMLGLVIAGRSAQLWSRLQLYSDAERWLELASRHADGVDVDPAVAGAVWRGLGSNLISSDPMRAGDAYSRAAECFRAAGDLFGEGRSLMGQGMLAALRGAPDQAEQTLLRARSMLAGCRRPRSYSLCLSSLAYLYVSTDRRSEAMQSLREALKVAKETNDPAAIGDIELSLAELSFLGGDPVSAATRAGAAIERLRLNRNRQLAFGLLNLAIYLEAAGRSAEARSIAAEALPLALARGDEILSTLVDLVALLGLEANIILSANLVGWVEETPLRRSQPRQAGDLVIHRRILDRLGAKLDAATLADALADGAVWNREEAAEVAAALLAVADERDRRVPVITQFPSTTTG